eukprot:GFUD01108187.1.p1 GENE.GFUD01108187.1~~GFUD01108187.1.p1  ORF type:complete len:247 (+),score=59.22 GFUD01108187.1:90-830(+)
MYHGEVNVAQDELNSFLAVAEDLRVKGLTQGQPTGYGTKKSYPPSPTSPPPKPAPQPPDRIPFHPRKHIQPPALPSNPPSTNNLVAYDEEEIQEVTPVKPEPDCTPPQQITQQLAPVPIRQEPFPSHPAPSLPPPSTMQDSLALQETYEEYEEYEENIFQAAEVVPEHVEGMQPSDLLQYTSKDLATGKHVCTLCSNFSHSSQANVRNHIESKHFPGTFVYTCQLCGKQSPSHQGLLKHKSKWHKK